MKKILALVLMDEDVFDELCSYRESRVEIIEALEDAPNDTYKDETLRKNFNIFVDIGGQNNANS